MLNLLWKFKFFNRSKFNFKFLMTFHILVVLGCWYNLCSCLISCGWPSFWIIVRKLVINFNLLRIINGIQWLKANFEVRHLGHVIVIFKVLAKGSYCWISGGILSFFVKKLLLNKIYIYIIEFILFNNDINWLEIKSVRFSKLLIFFFRNLQ